jgi:hypothetical protein
MTPTPEQIDALVKAAEMALEHLITDSSDWAMNRLENALIPFREPEWEYVLPEWDDMPKERIIYSLINGHMGIRLGEKDSCRYIEEYTWNQIRELTKRPKTKNPAT